MYTTTDEQGIINNYASEPDMYYAITPSPEQQRTYLYQGAVALLIVTCLIFTSFAIS